MVKKMIEKYDRGQALLLLLDLLFFTRLGHQFIIKPDPIMKGNSKYNLRKGIYAILMPKLALVRRLP